MSSEALNLGPPAATPGEPRWLLSGLYAALVTAAIGWSAWPGMMSYDSLFAYRESREGILTSTWPPMHTYLFWLSDKLGVGPGGVLVLQVFLLFFGAAVSLNVLVKSRPWAIAGLAAFTLSFLYIPELLGTVIVQWRDVTTTSFALAGVAAWLVAARYGSLAALVLAGISISLALSLRYNAAALFVVIVPLVLWSPFLGRMLGPRTRGTALLVLALGCGLAFASTQVRLPDFRELPTPQNFAGAQAFDLIGISACADRNYLPPALTAGAPITPRQIRQVYDPRDVVFSYRQMPGAPQIKDLDLRRDVPKAWPVAVSHEPGCYLSHRMTMFVHQMGMAREGIFLPGYFSIDANPYGFASAHRGIMQRAYDYVSLREREVWRRPVIVYLFAPLVIVLLWRRSRARLVFLALLGGAFAYPALLFIAAPATDFRYIFPSTVFCTFILSAGGAVIMESRRQRLARTAFSSPLDARLRNSEGVTTLLLRIRWPGARRP